MTARERVSKNVLFFLISFYYLGGYLAINELTARRGQFYRLALPFEQELPFLPALIFAYLLEFVFMAFAYLAVDNLAFFRKMAAAFFLCVTLHFVVFLIFPVEYHLRPDIDPDRGWAYRIVSFYYWLDLPYNCFPSLHVSNVFLIAFIMDRYRRGLGWILHPLALLVAISVVLVKQHYVVDVVAGFFVGWFVYRQVFQDFAP
jgi:membrane-associated phospholipid phosphatase